MGAHIDKNGNFQSDKYPSCPPGKVPLSVTDPTAQDLLWEYAQRRRAVDAEFADDLEAALRSAGYVPNASWVVSGGTIATAVPTIRHAAYCHATIPTPDRPDGGCICGAWAGSRWSR